MENIISVKNVSKLYRIYNRPIDRLKQALLRDKKQFYKPVWALKDISFDIAKGEVFGIIGMNGAGKTTLLQILAGILEPTEGEVKIKHKTLNLIELGSGMDLEYSGIDNILQYGLVLGQSKKHIESNIDKAVKFADIGDFINQPLKTYSTGMIMRLAFSVITICNPDILLIDEIISVGDINFRMKCFKWLEDFIKNGGTVCIVSHDIHLIANKCDRVAFLRNGKLDLIGKPFEVIEHFKHESVESYPDHELPAKALPKSDSSRGIIPSDTPRKGNKKALITKCLINNKEFGEHVLLGVRDPIVIDIEAVFYQKFKHYSFSFAVITPNGIDLFAISSSLTDTKHPELIPYKPIRCLITVNHNLQHGEYLIKLGLGDVPGKLTAERLDVIEGYTKIIVTGTSETYGYITFPYEIEFPPLSKN